MSPKLVDVSIIETVDIPLRNAKRSRIKLRTLSKSGTSVGLCKRTEVRNGPHGGKRQCGEAINPLKGQKKMIVDRSINQEERTLREGKEDGEAESSSTLLLEAFSGKEAPTWLGRNT